MLSLITKSHASGALKFSNSILNGTNLLKAETKKWPEPQHGSISLKSDRLFKVFEKEFSPIVLQLPSVFLTIRRYLNSALPIEQISLISSSDSYLLKSWLSLILFNHNEPIELSNKNSTI